MQFHRRGLAPWIESNKGPRNECNSSDVAWPSPKGEARERNTRVLGSHRFRFAAVPYSGAFIENEDTSYSGRYGHIATTFFRFGSHTVVMHAHKLAIWIHDAEGSTLVEQRKDAEQKAEDRLALFAHERALMLEAHDFRRLNGSEHTVEDRSVDAIMRPMLQEEQKFFDERLGIAVNTSSHKGKIELHERNRDQTGPQFPRGKRFEFILDEFPVRVLPAMSEAISSNAEALSSSAAVNRSINALLVEIVGAVKDIRDRVEVLEMRR
jgi:hypothetical protein